MNHSQHMKFKSLLFAIVIQMGFLLPSLQSQNAFACSGQAYLISESSNELIELTINPSNNALNFNSLSSDLGIDLDALSYRKTDNLLYAIDPINHHLFQIDAAINVVDLGDIDLENNLEYRAGEITPDGQYLVTIGSQNNVDQMLSKIDLSSGNFEVENIGLGNPTQILDITFDPYDGRLYGYDALNKTVLSMDLATASVLIYPPVADENELEGLFFDAFGNLFGYGTSVFGVTTAIFSIDKNTGLEVRKSTGPVLYSVDLTACPYGVEMTSLPDPIVSFPCNEITYNFTVANASGQTLSDVVFEQNLPFGFDFVDLLQNPFGGSIDQGSPNSIFRLENLIIPSGIDSFKVIVEIGNVPGGEHFSQGVLKNLPPNLGNKSLSDFLLTTKPDDSSPVSVNIIEEDSIFFSQLLCAGESTVLDGGQYGNNLQWNVGSSVPQLEVTEPGLYVLNATSGCQTTVVSFDITVASCPFTIELGHLVIPEETLPCSEVTYRYIIENDSGEKRESVGFLDTLPPGFTFLDILENPFGGNLNQNVLPNIIDFKEMTLDLGIDTLDILVEVGNIAPGLYHNLAIIYNFPTELGPFRISDYPNTVQVDTTPIRVLGVDTDSLFLEPIICRGTELILDASDYGVNFLWNDGSIDSTLVVSKPGNYSVVLFDGCEPTYIYYDVREGTFIDLDIDPIAEIHLGDSLLLEPIITNHSDSLFIEWYDPLGTTLSCLNCKNPMAKPLRDTKYQLTISNEECADSALIMFLVDNTRRIYAPNVFSPNFDGINDYFYLQSPDFGRINSFKVFDRWGSLVFHSSNSELNNPTSGWDGSVGKERIKAGVFLWEAEIVFLDGLTEILYGDISIIK